MLPHLAMANGIALSPAGKELWVTEFSRNLLHRVELVDATTIAPIGTAIAYHFTGPAPDSMRSDSDGNLYVAIYGQGRVLVLNRKGIPIGQVSLPGRDEGHNLQSTNMAIKPGTKDLFIVTSDGDGGQGTTISTLEHSRTRYRSTHTSDAAILGFGHFSGSESHGRVGLQASWAYQRITNASRRCVALRLATRGGSLGALRQLSTRANGFRRE